MLRLPAFNRRPFAGPAKITGPWPGRSARAVIPAAGIAIAPGVRIDSPVLTGYLADPGTAAAEAFTPTIPSIPPFWAAGTHCRQ